MKPNAFGFGPNGLEQQLRAAEQLSLAGQLQPLAKRGERPGAEVCRAAFAGVGGGRGARRVAAGHGAGDRLQAAREIVEEETDQLREEPGRVSRLQLPEGRKRVAIERVRRRRSSGLARRRRAAVSARSGGGR